MAMPGHPAQHLKHHIIYFPQTLQGGASRSQVLQRRNVWLREGKWLAQGHTAPTPFNLLNHPAGSLLTRGNLKNPCAQGQPWTNLASIRGPGLRAAAC